MKKVWLPVLFLMFFAPLYGEKIVLFEKPQLGARFLVIDRSEVIETGRILRQVSPLPHPLCRILSFKEMLLPRSVKAYHRADIVADANNKVVWQAEFPRERAVGGFLCVAALVILLCRRIFYHAADWELLFIPVFFAHASCGILRGNRGFAGGCR